MSVTLAVLDGVRCVKTGSFLKRFGRDAKKAGMLHD